MEPLVTATASEAPPLLQRYDGAERRVSRGAWLGVERRLIDPATEQDHPEVFGAQE